MDMGVIRLFAHLPTDALLKNEERYSNWNQTSPFVIILMVGKQLWFVCEKYIIWRYLAWFVNALMRTVGGAASLKKLP